MNKRWLFLITSFILLAGPLQAEALVNAERQGELLNLLYQDCGSCHGLTLAGGLGPSLQPNSLNFKPDDLLVSTILEGRLGTAMPPWKTFLSRDEARWLVSYLKQRKEQQQ